MNGHEVRESWGCPRRIAHTYEWYEVRPWRLAGLLYVVVTWIIGQALIIKELWKNF